MPRPSFADDQARFLPIWAEDYAAVDMGRIRAAKVALDLPYQCYPRHASAPKSDEYGRVLAVDSRPPYVCDYALVTAQSDDAGLRSALLWVLGENDDPRATYMPDVLSKIFGVPVREIPQDELDAEAALRAYSNE